MIHFFRQARSQRDLDYEAREVGRPVRLSTTRRRPSREQQQIRNWPCAIIRHHNFEIQQSQPFTVIYMAASEMVQV